MRMSISREIEDIARDLVRHQHDHPPVRDLNQEADAHMSTADKAANDLARMVGSWLFILIQAVLIVVWIGLNVLSTFNHWDAYPFAILNLVLSLEAGLWAVIVLMSLRIASDRDRLRAQHDYEQDVKTEEETKALMNHLMHQDEILLQIVQRLDRTDRELKRLAQRLEG